MATAIKSSFDDLSDTAFQSYARGLVDAQDTADKRQRAISYLAQVGAQDKAAQDLAGSVLNQKRFLRQKQATIVETLMVNHAFDFSKSAPLFAAPSAKTDAEILALAAQDDADIFLRDRTITGDLVVTGDRVKISGLGASGTALGGGIAHTVQINGQITIGADDLILEGIHGEVDQVFGCEREPDAAPVHVREHVRGDRQRPAGGGLDPRRGGTPEWNCND